MKDIRGAKQTLLLEEAAHEKQDSFLISFEVKNLPVSETPTDLYIRLRGKDEDSCLILYRLGNLSESQK